MDSRDQHTPLWLLPQQAAVPSLRKRRPAISYVVNTVALIALIPMFLFVAPESIWQPQVVFALLLSAGFVSAAAALDFRKFILVDSGSAVALITAVLLGPLPAFCVYAAGEPIYLFREYLQGRQPLAFISNLALCGWSALAAVLPLAALGIGPNPNIALGVCLLVIIGGLLMVLVNWMVLLLNGALHDGQNLSSLATSAATNFSADLFLIAGSVAILLAYEAIGPPALTLLSLLILLPRMIAPLIYRSREVRDLSRSEATQRYAELMARELGLDRERQPILMDAAAQAGGKAELQTVDNFQDVMQVVLYSNERWDGAHGGFPGVLSGDDIPLESRVLAVSRAWAELTAKGTQGLRPGDALQSLRANAGSELDPKVVAAAVKVFEDELVPGMLRQKVEAANRVLRPNDA